MFGVTLEESAPENDKTNPSQKLVQSSAQLH